MKKIEHKDYKFKLWEKIIFSIFATLFIFFSAPLTILFVIISVIITLEILGPLGYIVLGIFALLIYSIIKNSILDD